MKLYFHPFSGNSRRVLLTAAHLEIPLEHHLIDLAKGEQRTPAHLGRQPNGVVPVLEDGGFVLWESRAIMQYLCEKTPGQTLLPSELKARADVQRWLFWCAVHMAPAAGVLVKERFVKTFRNEPPDPVEEKRGEELFAQYASVLDAHLANKTWIAQDRLTLADYSIACGFALAVPARLPLEPYKHVRSWFGRVTELPAWQKTQPPR
jgi:glutathione S-transferase